MFGRFAASWLPDAARTPALGALVYACAGVLIFGGVALQARRTMASSAIALSGLFAALLAIFQLAPALAKFAEWGGWQAVAESAAMAAGGALAYSLEGGVSETRGKATATAARLVFGVCLLVFGISHFAYAKYTASLVPTWLPLPRVVWASATGVAQFMAGLSMLSKIYARLAAVVLTMMYSVFGMMVHLPAILARPFNHEAWAENAINLLLVGAAWCLADSLSASQRL